MDSPLKSRIIRERRYQLFFFLGALVSLFAAITFIENLLVSFLLAFVTYYILSPFVGFFERRGLSKVVSTTIPFLLMTLIVVASFQILVPVLGRQFSSLQEDFPKYMAASSSFVEQIENRVNLVMDKIYPINLRERFVPSLESFAQSTFQNLPALISKSLTILFLAPFLAFFMLLDGRDFVRRLLSLVPNDLFELVIHLNHQISSQMGSFVRARILESGIVGFVIWAGLMIMDFPYALVLAIFAGILNIIPYLGPIIGAAPAIIINFANGGSNMDLFWLLSIYSLAQVIDMAVIVPFVVAKIVDLHPVTVILAVIIGAQMMGILGMIISIPVFSALKLTTYAVYKHFTGFRNS